MKLGKRFRFCRLYFAHCVIFFYVYLKKLLTMMIISDKTSENETIARYFVVVKIKTSFVKKFSYCSFEWQKRISLLEGWNKTINTFEHNLSLSCVYSNNDEKILQHLTKISWKLFLFEKIKTIAVVCDIKQCENGF